MKVIRNSSDARPGCLSRLVRRLSAFAWGWEIARTKDHAMLVKCHDDNCRSITQLSHELSQARDAEMLVRLQFAAVRNERDRLRTALESVLVADGFGSAEFKKMAVKKIRSLTFEYGLGNVVILSEKDANQIIDAILPLLPPSPGS